MHLTLAGALSRRKVIMAKVSKASVTVDDIPLPVLATNPTTGLSKSAIKADLGRVFKAAYLAAEAGLGRALSEEDKITLRARVMAQRDERFMQDGFVHTSDKTACRLRKGKTDQLVRTVGMARDTREGEEAIPLETALRNVGAARLGMEKAYLEPGTTVAPFRAWERLVRAVDMLVSKVDQYKHALPHGYSVRAERVLTYVEEWARVAQAATPSGEVFPKWPIPHTDETGNTRPLEGKPPTVTADV